MFPPIYPPLPSTSKTMEVTDRVLGEGMTHAEKKCRKIRAGAVPFSETLAKAGHHVKLWRLVVRHKVTNSVSMRIIRRLAQYCGIHSVLSVSLLTARHHLAESKVSHTQLKRTAHRLRYDFLCEREDAEKSDKVKRVIHNI